MRRAAPRRREPKLTVVSVVVAPRDAGARRERAARLLLSLCREPEAPGPEEIRASPAAEATNTGAS